MRAFALRLASSGRFVKATFIFQAEEMSTFASPTIPSSQLTSDQLTVLVASFSSLVFFFVVIVLLSIIYRKDPQCCKHGSYQDPHADTGDNVHRSALKNSYLPQLQGERSKGLLDPPDTDAPPQYYSSRQTLVGSPCLEQTHIPEDSVTQLPGELFYVGLPSSYSLPALEATLPRLPSYESVRKKDRQRQIHMMIADRFGLNGPIVTESPPSYEESIRQSVELPCDILSSDLDVPLPQRAYMSVSPGYTTDGTVLPPV